MNCAWCNTHTDASGSHGICDACMLKFFNIDPRTIHQEITDEEARRIDVSLLVGGGNGHGAQIGIQKKLA